MKERGKKLERIENKMMYPQNYGNYTSKILPNTQTYVVNGLKGRPVSSLEEARASAVDFDGSVFYFPDLANKRIYTKQINMDGTASLNMYELREMPLESAPTYVTREEFETAIMQLKASLQPISTPSVSAPAPAPEEKEKNPMPPLNF